MDAQERAAWFGAPRDGVPALDPAGPVPARVRWLAGVCLGAVGRYGRARRWLAPDGAPVDSLAASCLASHLRQVGRHAEAEPLDRLALDTADSAEAEGDARLGLVADAIGTAGVEVAVERLKDIPTVGRVINDYSGWRNGVRVAWITAEINLCQDDFTGAVEAARVAVERSRHAIAPRHAVKSGLVLGASLDAAGRLRPAARVLRATASAGTRLDLIPLVAVACTLRAGILRDRAPHTAARERHRADSAQRNIEDPADSPMTR